MTKYKLPRNLFSGDYSCHPSLTKPLMATIQLKRDFKILGLRILKGHCFVLIHLYLLFKRCGVVREATETGAYSSARFQWAAEFSLLRWVIQQLVLKFRTNDITTCEPSICPIASCHEPCARKDALNSGLGGNPLPPNICPCFNTWDLRM